MYISNKIKVSFLVLFCALTFSGFSQNKKFKVTLDAGHGAHDFGAVYHGHIEKNITLAVTLKVGKILESQPSVEVNYTRKTDVFIDLIERANIANRVDANIFVSMHCNANKNIAASGTETFLMGMTKNASNLAAAKKENQVITLEKDYKQKYEGYDPNAPETLIGMTLMQEEFLENSIALASKIQDRFTIDLGKKNRGLSQAPFMVLHKAYMPRVLIEMGFISNITEGALLDSEEGQNEIAKAIADAIMSYKRDYFGNGDTDEDERPSQKINEKPIRDTSGPVKETLKIASETPKETNRDTPTGTVFKVQISASSKKIELIPSNFKGLRNISITNGSGIYKYMYGETTDFNEAKKNLEEAKSKGYNSAFLIAFKNGNRIDIQEAVK
ncbi:N-acetylmuramoyl-L-alanine amidase [Flavobacterium sp. GT3R68]|uniref:N-acetylmuramoyl-L-alanine amidase family protein n=1 Tax=Flavobacterium sp. GT3R68 TaxID=2594437 RepID=UPI000F88ED4A|nr:N-acetylmuramoyl-L-alanine amidase [Flavobacterium sp. GT3R68]RTY93612.1 N-acetylmuramoyl-L-alanine amidase [Flavobacterium sp. GSN2]TRW91667.1 N-acetylmuramoyl-L-alanine amidase [Flavobacterium sp. GT3R68]